MWKCLAGQLRSRRSFASCWRVWSLSEAVIVAGLFAGVLAVRFLRLQSIVHGGHTVTLVQGTGFGEHGRCSQKTPRHSREPGAVDGVRECDVDMLCRCDTSFVDSQKRRYVD